MDETEQQARQRLREKYQAYLREVWKKPDNCPVCDSTFWNVADLVDVPVREVVTDPFAVGLGARKAYVYVPVTCVYCGFTMLFHSGVLDIRGTEEIKAVPPLRAPEEK